MNSAYELELHFKYVHFQEQPVMETDTNNVDEAIGIDPILAENWMPSELDVMDSGGGMHSNLPFDQMNDQNDTNYYIKL